MNPLGKVFYSIVFSLVPLIPLVFFMTSIIYARKQTRVKKMSLIFGVLMVITTLVLFPYNESDWLDYVLMIDLIALSILIISIYFSLSFKRIKASLWAIGSVIAAIIILSPFYEASEFIEYVPALFLVSLPVFVASLFYSYKLKLIQVTLWIGIPLIFAGMISVSFLYFAIRTGMSSMLSYSIQLVLGLFFLGFFISLFRSLNKSLVKILGIVSLTLIVLVIFIIFNGTGGPDALLILTPLFIFATSIASFHATANWKPVTYILRIIAVIIFSIPLLVILYNQHIDPYNYQERNPFDNVVWELDSAESSNEYPSIQPVLASDPSVKLGPRIASGQLRFEDLDGDEIKEAIIESRSSDWSTNKIEHVSILKYQEDENGMPAFVLSEEGE